MRGGKLFGGNERDGPEFSQQAQEVDGDAGLAKSE
jgi:hypothetical protein